MRSCPDSDIDPRFPYSFLILVRTLLQRFSSECRKAIIGFALTTLHDWLKNSRHYFIQSEVKPSFIQSEVHTSFPALHVSYT